MKFTLISIIAFSLFAFSAKAQVGDGVLKSQAKTFLLNDSTNINIGDTILFDMPVAQDFAFVKQQKKANGLSKLKAIGEVASSLGTHVAVLGVNNGSLATFKTATNISSAGRIAETVGMTSESIDKLSVSKKAKALIGMKTIVEKFEPASSEMPFIKAIVFNPKNKKRYDVIIAPAIYSNEVFLVNKIN